jgi:hypothetical protein
MKQYITALGGPQGGSGWVLEKGKSPPGFELQTIQLIASY